MIRFTFKVGKKIKDNTTTKRKKKQEPIKGVLLEVGGVHYEIMGDAFFYFRTAHHSLLFHYYFIYKQHSANLTVGICLIADIACTRLSLPSEVLKRYFIVFSNFMIDFRQY